MRPRRLQTRVLWLLIVVVVLALVASLSLITLSSREHGAHGIARALHAQVAAADALLAGPDRGRALARMQALGLRWRAQPPSADGPRIPLLLRVQAELDRRLPGRDLRLSGQPAELWIRVAPAAGGAQGGWIGVPVLGDAQPLRRGVLLSILVVGVLLLSAAAWFARGLTRPLRALAEAAPRIVAGESPPAPARGASDEVLAVHRALTEAAERTAAAARDRELLLAGLSHDMRTPLARMRYALALAEGSAEEAGAAQRHALQRDLQRDLQRELEQDIEILDAMVGQFIDYVRDGRDEPEQTLDLVVLLQTAIADQSRQGRVWALSLPERAATLPARPLALRRAIDNLLENAARHGAPPFALELDAQGAGWRLRVNDRGPGVPAAALPDLGRPFHRVDRARGTPGSGLGLASVARVAAVHGGGLRLHHRPGGGLSVELFLATPPP